jgi:flagellar basal body P-ring formation protein FlgA
MARTATLLLFLALASPAAAQVTPPAAPILKPTVTVSGDIVRIGDLIENAGAVAEVAIFRSPDPGTTGIVPTTRIVEAVRSRVFGLDTNGIAEVSVTRAGRAVGLPELEARIARALAAQYGLGDAKNVALTFDREFRSCRSCVCITTGAPPALTSASKCRDARGSRRCASTVRRWRPRKLSC